jgi:hypothetical protein
MPDFDPKPTRRCVLIAGAASMLQVGTPSVAAEPVITVHRDPNCGCCLGWAPKHLQKAGFSTKVLETGDLDAVKTRPAFRISRPPHGGSIGLCDRRTCSSPRAPPVSCRQAVRNRLRCPACRSAPGHGGRAETVCSGFIRARRPTVLHAIRRKGGG